MLDPSKTLNPRVCGYTLLANKDYPQSSDEVASFIKLLVILKFYFHCLENVKAPVGSFNATRLKENLLELNASLEAT